MCNFCIENKTQKERQREKEVIALFSAAYISSLANDIYYRTVTVFNLPKEVYYKTARLLSSTIPRSAEIAPELIDSVYTFSAAKTYQQVLKANSLLVGENGGLKPYDLFKKEFKKEFALYNEDYLLAEYNTAVVSAENAILWQSIEANKSNEPYIEYTTQRDSKVRPEHAALDKIVRKVDDPFWNTYMPPNAWNCRCYVTPLANAVETNLGERDVEKANVKGVFRTNSGKTKTVFSSEHPYYNVRDVHKQLQTNNFNLPKP